MDRGSLQTEKAWADDDEPRLLEGNGEQLAAVVLGLLDNPRASDGVKYYLFRTLSGLLGVPTKIEVLKKETQEKIVLAALKMIAAKKKFFKNTPQDELDGYRALRREAVKVVAKTPSPTIADRSLPALVLAQIAAGDESISPAPRLDERIEAAIGLARLAEKAEKFPDFQADYAAAAIAQAVRSFGVQANMNIDKKGIERLRPWRVDAARLAEAVDAMKGNGKNAFINTASGQCQKAVLTNLAAALQIPARPNDLADWLERNPPPSKTLFKSVSESTIKPGAAE
jgi:hypothetical protein